MRLRQFTGATTADALRALRDALGEEALVLSTQSEAGRVVITAAVGVDDEPVPASDAWPAAAEPPPIHRAADAASESLRFDLALISTRLDQLGRKLRRIDRALVERDGPGTLGNEGRDLAERLVASGLGAHLAGPVAQGFEREIAQARPRAEALRGSLLAHVPVASGETPRIEALVGSTGCGKTTTVAKLAAHALLAGGRAPGLVLTDDERVGALEPLASYARLLGAPLCVARDAAELRAALDELAGCERILIDTTGLSGDASTGVALQALLASAGQPIGMSAVISATASLSSLQRAWPQLARLAPERCIVTKLDECDEPGTACTWLSETGLPLAWLGTGRRVPDDLVAASGDEIVRWLVAA